MEKKRKFESTNSIPNSLFPNANLPDINRQIADFLHYSLTRANDKIKSLRELPELSSHQIEIEAKLGHLVNKQSETRIRLPVMSETILNDSEIEFKFISNMTMRQHSSYNQLLNHFAGKIKLKYVHTKATDQFLLSPSLRNVRRTIDEETTVTIVKTKIEHLNIYIPRLPFDCRITVNVESKVNVNDELKVQMERKKDRLTYSLFPFQIDLTQVKALQVGNLLI
jgi:hypothetical protein